MDATVAQATFDFDSSPGVYTESTKVVSINGITKVELVPSPQDYIAYDELTFTVCGSGLPVP